MFPVRTRGVVSEVNLLSVIALSSIERDVWKCVLISKIDLVEH